MLIANFQLLWSFPLKKNIVSRKFRVEKKEEKKKEELEERLSNNIFYINSSEGMNFQQQKYLPWLLKSQKAKEPN